MSTATATAPTQTRTPTNFDVLPQIKQGAAPTKAPLSPPQPTQSRPIDYHAVPKNIPDIQQQIQKTAQPYNPKPWYDGKPSGATVGSASNLRSVTALTAGQSYARTEAEAAMAYAAGVAITGFYDGVTKAYSTEKVDRLAGDPDLGAPYYFGNKAGEKLRDLWDNPPSFEIPTIKIPKFEVPGLPDIFKPKPKPVPQPSEQPIPGQPKPTVEEPPQQPEPQQKEKDIPRIPPPTPTPTPTPTDLTRQLRDLELSPCGDISFNISYVAKYLGEYFVENEEKTGGYFEKITVPSSLDEVYGLYCAYYTKHYGTRPGFFLFTLEQWLESGGGTGSNQSVDMGNGIRYRTQGGIGNKFYEAGPFIGGYPYYYASNTGILIDGLKNKSAIGEILDSFSANGKTPEVYRINVSNRNAEDCPLGKQLPPGSPPPPPPPKDCDCMSQCCPEIDYRKIQKMIEDAVEKIALATPESWLIRPEHHRPQMIIQFGEMLANKKVSSPKYPLTIPHPRPNKPNKSAIPAYKKGNWEIIFVLKDNSKIVIHALNEIEGMKVLNAAKALVLPDYVKDGYLSKSGKVITNTPLSEIAVTPRMAKYFPDGRKSQKPEWIVKF